MITRRNGCKKCLGLSKPLKETPNFCMNVCLRIQCKMIWKRREWILFLQKGQSKLRSLYHPRIRVTNRNSRLVKSSRSWTLLLGETDRQISRPPLKIRTEWSVLPSRLCLCPTRKLRDLSWLNCLATTSAVVNYRRRYNTKIKNSWGLLTCGNRSRSSHVVITLTLI